MKKHLPLFVGSSALIGILVLAVVIWQAWQAGPRNFGEHVQEPVVVETKIVRHYPDLCPGVAYFDDTVTRRILAQYVDGRSWLNGSNGMFLTRDDGYREISGEWALGAAGRDPRDGCPYELIAFKGNSFMFAIKRDSADLDGHYSVQIIQLYKEPVKELPGFIFDDEGLNFHYEAVDGSEVWESIPFEGNFSVG